MAFNLEEEEDLVYIELSIKPEICDIVNMEMERERDYWKTKALENGDQSSLLANAPKGRKLRARRKAIEKSEDIDTILMEHKSNYSGEEIQQLGYLTSIPSIRSVTFEEVRRRVEECSIMSRKSKNFVDKNGYTFGSWLLLAERVYRRERFLNRNHSLPKQFAVWVKAFGVSKTSADTYKRIYKLVSKAPRLINCQMSVNRFLKHYDIMIEYFDSDVQSPWKHALTCSCESCLSYFSF